ncbi:MAG: metalloregulator ArsR/SmtB family transcription factor [Thermodesulfovibrionales bacterium]|nr:metalloregulator ArsR/SmtB family transcription factor [Thermodesulfovibrionales bacterium]
MKQIIKLMKLFSDPLRLRIFMLLTERELCVCQLMAIVGASQPLVSRNLGLLREAGLLSTRRDGKLLFYRISEDLSQEQKKFINNLKELLKNDPQIRTDRLRIVECEEFQKRTGRCDMNILKRFMQEVHG